MSQCAFLAALDADLHAAFSDSGMADTGTYTAPGGAPQAGVRVYVDSSLQNAFDAAYGPRTTVTLLRADVADPVRGAALVVDGRTYLLDAPQDADDGVTVWTVRHG